jgi:hypothetical protein
LVDFAGWKAGMLITCHFWGNAGHDLK